MGGFLIGGGGGGKKGNQPPVQNGTLPGPATGPGSGNDPPAPPGIGGPDIDIQKYLDAMQRIAEEQAGYSRQIFGLTAPLRGQTTDLLMQSIRGERPDIFRIYNPAQAAAFRANTESQWQNAQQNLLSQTPMRGGQLNQALANLQSQRALGYLAHEGAVQREEQDLRRQAFSQALSTGYGQVPVVLQGLGSAGGLYGLGAGVGANVLGAQLGAQTGQYATQANLFNAGQSRALETLALLGQLMAGSSGQYGQSSQAKKSNLSSMAGGMMGAFCWVAAALYGRGTREWGYARRWMQASPWRVVGYYVIGPAVGWVARRSATVRWALRPYFDRAVLQGAALGG